MSKAVEINEIEAYSKRLCDFCDLKIAQYKMMLIKDDEEVASTLFCADCFNGFLNSCLKFQNEGEDNDEKCKL